MKILICRERWNSCNEEWLDYEFDEAPIKVAYQEPLEIKETKTCEAYDKLYKRTRMWVEDNQELFSGKVLKQETSALKYNKEKGWEVEKVEDNIANLVRIYTVSLWYFNLDSLDQLKELFKKHEGNLRNPDSFYNNKEVGCDLVWEL